MVNRLSNGVAIFGVLIICIVSFGVSGCSVAPRDSVYCIKNQQWVKCPKGTLPGTGL